MTHFCSVWLRLDDNKKVKSNDKFYFTIWLSLFCLHYDFHDLHSKQRIKKINIRSVISSKIIYNTPKSLIE